MDKKTLTIAERLALLPPHEPGRILTIELDLLPGYLAKYGLSPAGISPLGNMYVKREQEKELSDECR